MSTLSATDSHFVDGGQIDNLFKQYSTYWAAYLAIEKWGFKNVDDLFISDIIDKVEAAYKRMPKVGKDSKKIVEIAKHIYSRIGLEFFEETQEQIDWYLTDDYAEVENEPQKVERIYPNYRDYYTLDGKNIVITRSSFGNKAQYINTMYFDTNKEALRYFEDV